MAVGADNEQINRTKLSNLKVEVHKRQLNKILTKWPPLGEYPEIRITTETN